MSFADILFVSDLLKLKVNVSEAKRKLENFTKIFISTFFY